MPSIIVPVGFDSGPQYPADPTERFYCEVLNGGNSMHLPESAYRVWALAFPDVESHRNLDFTREKLAYIASDTTQPSIATAQQTIDELVSAGLLVEYEPGTPSALDFLTKHRIHATAHGMGSTPEEPEMFRIGRAGQVVLDVFYDIYAVWSGGKDAPSIWHTVQTLAPRPGPNVPDQKDLGYTIAGAIPALVSLDLAYLDQIHD